MKINSDLSYVKNNGCTMGPKPEDVLASSSLNPVQALTGTAETTTKNLNLEEIISNHEISNHEINKHEISNHEINKHEIINNHEASKHEIVNNHESSTDESSNNHKISKHEIANSREIVNNHEISSSLEIPNKFEAIEDDIIELEEPIMSPKEQDTESSSKFILTEPVDDGDIEVDDEGKLARSFIASRGFTADQIAAYEDMIDVQIPKILHHYIIRVDESTHVAITNPRISPPSISSPDGCSRILLPQTAREEKRNYSLTIKVDLEWRKNHSGELINDPHLRTKITGVEIAKIPVMIGSRWDNLRIHNYDKDKQKLLQIGECPWDPKGYFIVKGMEKMLLIQENLRTLRPFLVKDSVTKDVVCSITCLTIRGSVIVSLSQKKGAIGVYISLLCKERSDTIPLFQLFRVMGMNDPDEVIDFILQFVPPKRHSIVKMQLQTSIKVSNAIPDAFHSTYTNTNCSRKHEQAFVGREMMAHTYNMVREALYPHIGIVPPQNVEEFHRITKSKLILLALMVARFTEYIAGARPMDNPDSWYNKRLTVAASKIQQLFRTLWEQTLTKVEDTIVQSGSGQRDLEGIRGAISHSYITKQISESFSSELWGPTRKNRKSNISVGVERGESILSMIDQLLRINTPVNRQGSQAQARSVQPDQWGYVDAVATPSSNACGLVKNKALGCEISVNRDDSLVREYLDLSGLIHDESSDEHHDLCMVNAMPLGRCNGEKVRNMLRVHRQKWKISHDISLVYIEEDRVLNIMTNDGRPVKPFLILDEVMKIERSKFSKMSFDELWRAGMVEWLDIWEAKYHCAAAHSIKLIYKIQEQIKLHTFQVGLLEDIDLENVIDSTKESISREITRLKLELTRLKRKKFTHSDLDPNLAFGVSASMIPWPDGIPGPRAAYQCNMGKQAMGQNHSNYLTHFSTTGKALTYPSRPIAVTQFQKQVGLDDLPAGHNIVLAIMTDPCNEEDAVVVKKEALERGLFNYVLTHSYSTEVRGQVGISHGNQVEKLIKPTTPFRPHIMDHYRHLDENGIVRMGSVVEVGDCLIGKVCYTLKSTKGSSKINRKQEDASVYLKMWQHGVVDYVRVTYDTEGNMLINVRVACVARPTICDKVASRQAQKSIFGCIKPEGEMPCTKDGITPDIIINPHALPKRMTISMYFEMITSKYGAMSGTRINATAFKDFSVDMYAELLYELYGYDGSGEETLYHFSGDELLSCKLMIGPCFYQLLKHLIQCKYQYRGKGPHSIENRQPPPGRSNNGGIRFGKQEVDGTLGHGAVNFLRDRTLVVCDIFSKIVCRSCNNTAIADMCVGTISCKICGGQDFGTSEEAYTQTLLAHYCSALTVNIKSMYTTPGEQKEQDNTFERGSVIKINPETDDPLEGDMSEEEIEDEEASETFEDEDYVDDYFEEDECEEE